MVTVRTLDRFRAAPRTGTAWWTVGLGVSGLVVGPFLGFGLVGLLVEVGALAAAVIAFRHGERSWLIWLGTAVAIGVICYLPFMSGAYPYTVQ